MLPLEDIRVVAVEQYGAGPFGSLHLADLGAEVIKVEDPRVGGDVGRYIPPFQEGEDSLFFETFNRNKKSLSLDLSVPEGRRVFEDLIAKSDAVYSNLRGDVPAKLRIRYDDLAEVNPRIVCVSVTGFGMTGPMSTEPAYDYILQGLAGWMSLTGEPDGPPTKTGLSLVDWSGGYVAATALLAGVHAARRDGKGMDCDISLYDVAVSLLTYSATWHLSRGWNPTRRARSAHPSLVPFQLFMGSDDNWFLVGCAKEKFFDRVAEIVGRPELADHPDYATFADRAEHRDALIGILDDLFSLPPGPLLDRAPQGGRGADRTRAGHFRGLEPSPNRGPQADRGNPPRSVRTRPVSCQPGSGRGSGQSFLRESAAAQRARRRDPGIVAGLRRRHHPAPCRRRRLRRSRVTAG